MAILSQKGLRLLRRCGYLHFMVHVTAFTVVRKSFIVGRALQVPALFWHRQTSLIIPDDQTSRYEKEDEELESLSSPRMWMEYLERERNITGAYTVLRCEYKLGERSWKVWGTDFHLERLRSSYRAAVSFSETKNQNDNNRNSGCDELEILLAATKASQDIMDKLLDEAGVMLSEEYSTPIKKNYGDTASRISILMVTLMWHSSPIMISEASPTLRRTNINVDSITVRGHACTAGNVVPAETYNPKPLVTALAWWPFLPSLPNRYSHNPQAKLSSWCSRRRPLEDLFKSKKDVPVDEVLLLSSIDEEKDAQKDKVDKEHTQGQILEGLTSNIFVVHRNGKLITSNSSILEGYARKLVLECAESCNLQIEFCESIPLNEIDSWEEVFVTSSVRLIVPVGRILMPHFRKSTGDLKYNDAELEFQELWSSPVSSNPKWKQLYTTILKYNA